MKKTIVEYGGIKYIIAIKPHSDEKTKEVPQSLLEAIWDIDESNDGSRDDSRGIAIQEKGDKDEPRCTTDKRKVQPRRR